MAWSQLTATSASQVQAILLPLPSWDYRHAPPCPANLVFLVETSFTILVRLVSNSRPQVICPPRLPKVLGLQTWAIMPGLFVCFYCLFWKKFLILTRNCKNDIESFHIPFMQLLLKMTCNITTVHYQKIHNGGPGMVAQACNPSTLGDQGGRITWAQEFETSMSNKVRPCLYKT